MTSTLIQNENFFFNNNHFHSQLCYSNAINIVNYLKALPQNNALSSIQVEVLTFKH